MNENINPDYAGVLQLLTEASDLSAKVTLDLSLLGLKLEKLRFLHQKLATLPNNAIVQSYGLNNRPV